MSGSWIASFPANISYQRRYPDHGLFDSVCAYTTNNESHSCVMLSRVKRASVPFKNACGAYVLVLLIRFIFTTQSKNQITARSLFCNTPCLKSLINEKEWPPEPVSGGMPTHRSHFLLSHERFISSTAPKLKLIRRIKWGTYFFFISSELRLSWMGQHSYVIHLIRCSSDTVIPVSYYLSDLG